MKKYHLLNISPSIMIVLKFHMFCFTFIIKLFQNGHFMPTHQMSASDPPELLFTLLTDRCCWEIKILKIAASYNISFYCGGLSKFRGVGEKNAQRADRPTLRGHKI